MELVPYLGGLPVGDLSYSCVSAVSCSLDSVIQLYYGYISSALLVSLLSITTWFDIVFESLFIFMQKAQCG